MTAALAALVRRAHTIGVRVDRVRVPVTFEGRIWRTNTRWVHLDVADTVLHVTYSALPHHPTWMVGAYWGHQPRRERHLVNPSVAELGALLDDIALSAPVGPAAVVEPLGQLSLLDLFAVPA